MNNVLRDVLRGPFHFLRNIKRMNVLKTLYFNFRVLPLRQAIKLPFYIYGKIVIHSLHGQITIDSAKIYPGMIKLGYRWFDLWPTSFLPTQFWVDGQLTFGENVVVSGGVGLFVQSDTAILRVGNKTRIGGGSMIKSVDKLYIGDFTRITGNCTILNSNMHYVKNIETGVVKKPWGQILIGKYCWINSGSIVTKGSIIPDYTIVARNSFLNKDYTAYGDSNLFIVGSPAKVTTAKVERIFKIENEQKYKKYFMENADKEELLLTPGTNEEMGDFELR